jgi:hypothetical protein
MHKPISNKYYLYLNRGQEPVSWNPPDPYPLENVNYSYFGKVFEAMERTFKVDGIVFYLTWDNVNDLPSYGSKVVAVIIGDEWCRIPMYFHKVLAVFKCYGTRPILGCNPFFQISHLNSLALLQFIKIWFNRFPGRINYVLNKSKRAKLFTYKAEPVYDIPIGYDRQLDLPLKDIEERIYDVFFAGSVVHRNYPIWSLKYWLENPKSCSRRAMISNISELKRRDPALEIELLITSSFGRSSEDALNESTYSEKMMNTKICLVPRGTSFETFRFFEAMRYGCIVIVEALPSRWFYDGSPAIQLKNWNELEILLPKLLENKVLMQEKHQRSLNWWKTKCSEEIVGNYIGSKLELLQKSDIDKI